MEDKNMNEEPKHQPKKLLLFGKVVLTIGVLSVVGTMLYNTATNFIEGNYWASAPFSNTVFVALIFPSCLLLATYFGLRFIWRTHS